MNVYKLLAITCLLLVMATGLPAANYVNWKGGFWFSIPDGWEKVDYRIVDNYLRMTDTSRAIYDYEVVYAPDQSLQFLDGPYVVITFDSTGQLSRRQSDSVLNEIVRAYSSDVYDAPIVKSMSDLVPGKPQLDRTKRIVSILSDLAYRPDNPKKLWQYMQINDVGLITFYFYSPDSTFESNKEDFDRIIESLSFENLREASKEQLRFTDIGGDDIEAESIEYADESDEKSGDDDSGSPGLYFLYAGGAIIVLLVIIRLMRR